MHILIRHWFFLLQHVVIMATSFWDQILSKKGLEFMRKNRIEIFSMYFKVGEHWNPELSEIKVGQTFTIPQSKYGVVSGTYKVMNSGITKSGTRNKADIIVKTEFSTGILFRCKGKLLYFGSIL